MPKISLITFDLDGTLLNRKKQLSERTARALQRASEAGITVVPATGRAFTGMPEALRNLPCIRYGIIVNGAGVVDSHSGEYIYRAEIPNAQALGIMRYLDTLPVVYDCFLDGQGYMSRSMMERLGIFRNPSLAELMQKTRFPVDDLKSYVMERGLDAQKVQLATGDPALRLELLAHLEERFSQISVSSSWPVNVEINTARATKGLAMQALAEHLGIPMSEVMAFGDASNDRDMIRLAGVGVVMENGLDELKAQAKIIAPDCDDDGVAQIIEKLL